ncbi:MAG: hypothetical protein KatS3mg095_0675 [Candidatus Parcubacteria bacterium]|nr:MAG: hypothetical protein KatS3mg095_0675 [Candidatus Parcubacteria bacterium]
MSNKKHNHIFFLLATFGFFLVLPKVGLTKINIGDFDHNILIPNGSVQSIVQTPSKIFLAGNFSYLGPYKGNGFLINLSNNLPIDLVDKINGIVWEVIPDDNGGWYVGGDFTSVGNYPIKKLAHILSNGQIDPNFSFEINDTVYALAKKNNILYIGGAFKNFNNTLGLNYLVAIDLNNNSVDEDFKIIPDDFVFDLVIDQLRNKLYVAGQFVSLFDKINNSSSDIQFLAAININSKLVDENFNLNINNIVHKLLITNDNTRLYFSGYFDKVSSLSRNYIAGFDLISKQILLSFNPDIDYVVLDMVQSKDGNNLYLGGRFRMIKSQPINYLALVNSSTGNLISSFNCQIESDDNETDIINSVFDVELDSMKNILYVGGSFRKVNGQFVPFFFRADVKNNQCQLIDEVNSFLPTLNINDRVHVLRLNNDQLFIGGRFSSYGGFFKKYLAAIDKNSGNLDQTFNVVVDKPVYKLIYNHQNNFLYLMGYFTKVNNVQRNYLASINLADYSLTNFKINFSTNTGDFISDIILDGNDLYLAGYFEKINNQNLKYLAKVNALTGQVNDYFHSINLDGPVNALALKDDILYLGGQFQNYLLAVNKNDGSLITSFKANVNNRVNTLFVDKNDNLLFVGGSFSYPGKNFVILNAQSGQIVNKDYSPNKPVLLITGDEENNFVFTSGYFDSLGSFNLEGNSFFILSYDNSIFRLIPLSLRFNNFVYSIDIDKINKKIYFGGNFVNNNGFNNFLVIKFQISSESQENKDDNRLPNNRGGGFTGGGGGGGSRVISPSTTTTTSDEALRLWLLQFVNQLLSQKQTATSPQKQTTITPTFKSKIKGIPDGFQFTRTLKFGMKGQDVKYLQIFLRAQGKSIYPERKVTGTFGGATRKAVIRFQEKYKKELKIKKADGIVQGATLRKINNMIKGK